MSGDGINPSNPRGEHKKMWYILSFWHTSTYLGKLYFNEYNKQSSITIMIDKTKTTYTRHFLKFRSS